MQHNAEIVHNANIDNFLSGIMAMANNVTVQSRIPPELKTQAETVFSNMGMSTADAIRIFLQQTVNEGGMPFQPRAKIPNAETILAMQEADEGKGESITLKELRAEMGLNPK